jgi:hypothetical protein
MEDVSLIAMLCLNFGLKVQFFAQMSSLVYENVYIGDLKGSELDAFVDLCVVVVDMFILWLLQVIEELIKSWMS